MRHRGMSGILRRRMWSVLACGVVGGVVVGGFSFVRVPKYSASARVLLSTDAPVASIGAFGSGTTSPNPSVDVAAQMDTVSSHEVVQRVVARLAGTSSAQLRRAVSVRRVNNRDLFVITASSSSRDRSARIVNAFAQSYIEVRRLRVVGAFQAVSGTFGKQLATLKDRIAELDGQVRAKSSPPAASAQLTAAATQYQVLVNRQQELQTLADLQKGAAVIAAPASAAGAAAERDPVRDGVIGGIVGLLLGLGIALTRELGDDRVRTLDDIGRATGLPVLAEFPRDQRSKKDPTRLAVHVSPRSALSEASRALRAAIELRSADPGRPSLLVTSAVAGEGKSLVSANLAAAYALAGYRTVLVDADLRTPRLSTVFGTYRAPLVASGEAVQGLSCLLDELGAAGADRPGLEHAALLRTPIENLLFLPAGPEPAKPSELLGSRAMAALLADLEAIADIVVIDAPPALPVSDAAGLAKWVGSIVLVAAVGESHRTALARAGQILSAHPRVLGVVANKVAPGAPYSHHRRATVPTPDLASSPLSVMRKLDVPPQPTEMPVENGDIWIDLSEDTGEMEAVGADPERMHSAHLETSSWGR